LASLSHILRVNAASCLAFGVLFLSVPEAVAAFLGRVPVWAVVPVGLGLIANGGHLLIASRRRPCRTEVLWFSAGDLLWWLASVLLVAFPWWVTTTRGQIAALSVASGVAFLGLAQLWVLALEERGIAAGQFWASLVAGWLRLELWVRLWLVILNLVFVVGLFLPAFARTVSLSYVASGPLLLGLVFLQGGFSKATGIGHLLAWVPLAVWLGDKLSSVPMAGIEPAYGLILAAALAICLCFDIYDLFRWLRGDRQIL
jgi:hypothetical protein